MLPGILEAHGRDESLSSGSSHDAWLGKEMPMCTRCTSFTCEGCESWECAECGELIHMDLTTCINGCMEPENFQPLTKRETQELDGREGPDFGLPWSDSLT